MLVSLVFLAFSFRVSAVLLFLLLALGLSATGVVSVVNHELPVELELA